jgi:uncharacterized protein
VIVVDTSVIVAYMNSGDDDHAIVTTWIEAVDDDLATTPLVVAEVDHLVRTRGGLRALTALYADLTAGAYLVEWWTGAMSPCVRIAEQYADIGIGLADASLVALADRLATTSIATLDERHFGALRPLGGRGAFQLLPLKR